MTAGPLQAERRQAARRRLSKRLGLKRFLPRTLFGRALLILVTPVVLLQVIATFIFYDRHWSNVMERLTTAVAGEIAYTIDLMDAHPSQDDRNRLFRIGARQTSVIYSFTQGETLVEKPPKPGYALLRRYMTEALRRRIDEPFQINPSAVDEWVEVEIQMPDGVLRAVAPMRRVFSFTVNVFMGWMVGSSVVLFTIAIVFMRNQIRPIRRLAAAADLFGKGRDSPEFRPEGALEVRQAAQAFIAMRDRLQRQIQQRTDMLAGVSHDLRTPLTRMKLQLELLGDSPEIDELKADVEEMKRMIDGYLAFARGEGTETPVDTDLTRLLAQACAAARRAGGEVEEAIEPGLKLPLRRQAFRRCVDNLIANAQSHAARLQLSARKAGRSVEIVIDDDGPGIPPERREDAFRPFVRLDPSRNPSTGGAGLGLTIARDVARGHGGDLTLDRSPLGGLRCIIRLPL